MKVARKNKSFLFKYMRCFKKYKPSELLLKFGEILKTEAVLIASGFQDNFISVYADSSDGPHPVLSPLQYNTALCQATFDVTDVGKFLKQVNPYSAVGPDYVHLRILKEALDTLALLPVLSVSWISLNRGFPSSMGRGALTC